MEIFIILYFMSLIIGLGMLLMCFDFLLTYLNIKEWTVANLALLPFMLGIYTILILVIAINYVCDIIIKCEPFLNKRLFK